jgi:glucose/arabinose dehydrogenase
MGKIARCALLLACISCFDRVSTSYGTTLSAVSVATGLARPLFVTAPKGDYRRAFIVEQRGIPSATQGRILVLDLTVWPHAVQATPFLTVSGLATSDEQGLLGLAFDPGYMSNGIFYTYSSHPSPQRNVVTRYVDSNPLDNVHTDAVAPIVILTISDPFTNHNGGWMDFGADGYLYIASGDGGGSCDTSGNAQNINLLLGKMLRINPNAGGYTSPSDNPFFGAIPGADEIWHYGLRNPWRCSFDKLTSDLYIGDVGQGAREEVDMSAPGVGGLNFGWNVREGFSCSNLSGCSSSCATAGFTNPIHDYVRSSPHCSITGGYVYRGQGMCDERGKYFFGDYCSGTFWSMPAGGGSVTVRTTELSAAGTFITSFGQDQRGELYICRRGSGSNGIVFKVMPATVPLIGDMNNDKLYTVTDGDLLALALIDPAAYAGLFPAINAAVTGDTNCDGFFDGRDIAEIVKRIVP